MAPPLSRPAWGAPNAPHRHHRYIPSTSHRGSHRLGCPPSRACRPPLRRPAPRAAYASAADSSYDSDAEHAASQPAIGAMSEEHRVVVVFEEMSKEQMLELLTRLNENDVEYNELKVSQPAACVVISSSPGCSLRASSSLAGSSAAGVQPDGAAGAAEQRRTAAGLAPAPPRPAPPRPAPPPARLASSHLTSPSVSSRALRSTSARTTCWAART